MSRKSNDQGRAYEYAWIETLYSALREVRNTRIVDNSSFCANRKAWENISEDKQRVFRISAESAVKTILELEPQMEENDEDELLLELKKDKAGAEGDVRDIVIKRNSLAWEVGLSIKHNHEAVKHSRLGRNLDFGKKWFGIPCSLEYWNDIKPVFDRLNQVESETKWAEIADKEDAIYVPLLNAFMKEITRACQENDAVPRRMIEYLIGTNDYYKVVSHDSQSLTIISAFNVHGTLNKPSKAKVSAITIPLVELPTEIVALRFKTGSKNTVEMYMNNGWQLSFRIHNASTKVENSLKFDTQFIGMPPTVVHIECKWNSVSN